MNSAAELVADLVRRTAVDRGLPEHIDDPAVLAAFAVAIRTVPSEERTTLVDRAA